MHIYKKQFGQHFLNDQQVIAQIMNALQQHKFEKLLEVGPGGGALTEHLLKLPNIEFKAVEIDADKISYLRKIFPDAADVWLEADFLAMQPPFEDSFTIIGNFPYNISTEILFKILGWKNHVPIIIGMFQKEVAQRIIAAPNSKTYGVTSALLQPFYDITEIVTVPPQAFTPAPKVDSMVIQLKRKENVAPVFTSDNYKRLVKTAFNQRRKKLRNAVKALFDADVLQDSIFDKRAENLSIHDFAALTQKMRETN